MMPRLDSPDIIALDLDPSRSEDFDVCIEAGLLVKKQLDRFGLRGYAKASGATGIHVYVPIKPRHTFAQSHSFAGIIARLCLQERPDLITLEPALGMRQRKLYLDYMQNVRGKTLASAYSVRAGPDAPVSAPLEWSELKPGLKPRDFTMKNMPERLADVGGLFAGALAADQDLGDALGRATN